MECKPGELAMAAWALAVLGEVNPHALNTTFVEVGPVPTLAAPVVRTAETLVASRWAIAASSRRRP